MGAYGSIDDYIAALPAERHHIGRYPPPADEGPLGPELAPYATGRVTAVFPDAQPIPYDLIARVVERLAAERG